MIYLFTALFLGIDAFLVSFAYAQLKNEKLFLLPILMGLFHIIFPLISFYVISTFMYNNTNDYSIISAIIFTILGISQFIPSDEKEIKPLISIITIVLVSISVSIDSILIGVSYGLSQTDHIVFIAILFGVCTFLMSLSSIYLSIRLCKIVKTNKLKYIAGLFFILLGILTFFKIF